MSLPPLPCACATLRRAARLVTRLYGHEMKGAMEPEQFFLLSALKEKPGARQTGLGNALGLDKTTLSRNLNVLKRHGWIEEVETTDRRERSFQLTRAGRRTLTTATPHWDRAQAKLREIVGARALASLMKAMDRLAEAARA